MKTKSKLCLFVVVLCTAQFISCKKDNSDFNALTSSQSVDDGVYLGKRLVAWYTFNGDVLDHSGNNNNVDFNNATPAAGKKGEPNTAYLFNGISNYMTVPNSVSLNPASQITLAALIKPTGVYTGPGATSRILMKGTDDQSNGVYFLGYFADGTAYGTYGDNQFESNGVGSPDSSFRPNRWYKLVYTYDGNVGKLYINGNLVNQLDKKATFTPNSDLLRIGTTGRSDYPYWFNGLIDEIRIYNTALTPTQIAGIGNELGK